MDLGEVGWMRNASCQKWETIDVIVAIGRSESEPMSVSRPD